MSKEAATTKDLPELDQIKAPEEGCRWIVRISTSKSGRGLLVSRASAMQRRENGIETCSLFEDFCESVIESQCSRATEKKIIAQHKEALAKWEEVKEQCLAHYGGDTSQVAKQKMGAFLASSSNVRTVEPASPEIAKPEVTETVNATEEPAPTESTHKESETVDAQERYEIEKRWHGKRECFVFVVVPTYPEGLFLRFKVSRAKARKFGGWYVRKFESNAGGFAFTTLENAELFAVSGLSYGSEEKEESDTADSPKESTRPARLSASNSPFQFAEAIAEQLSGWEAVKTTQTSNSQVRLRRIDDPSKMVGFSHPAYNQMDRVKVFPIFPATKCGSTMQGESESITFAKSRSIPDIVADLSRRLLSPYCQEFEGCLARCEAFDEKTIQQRKVLNKLLSADGEDLESPDSWTGLGYQKHILGAQTEVYHGGTIMLRLAESVPYERVDELIEVLKEFQRIKTN